MPEFDSHPQTLSHKLKMNLVEVVYLPGRHSRLGNRLASLICLTAIALLASTPLAFCLQRYEDNLRLPRTQLIATNFPGSDIGAQVNAAFASCSGQCSVSIPEGIYKYSTTINIPIALQSGPALVCDSLSTRLMYTGSGDAIAALGTGGESESGLTMHNCTIDGILSQSGANGLHLRAFGNGLIDNLRIIGFSGAGLLNEGANSVTFFNPDFESNYINVHNVGVVVNGQGWSANSNKIYGGIIGYATKWGVFEDAALVNYSYPNGGNIYDGVNFERNGTTGQMSGNAFLQWCDGCVITNSYLEFFNADHIPENVVIGGTDGDAVGGVYATPQGVKIINNHMLSDNAVDSVLILNGRMVIVENNSEVGNPTNFVNMKGNVQWSYVGHNLALAAANPIVNNDTGSGGGGLTNSADVQPTATGYAFNSLTGDSSDLSIMNRPGGTDNLIGEDASGDIIYQIYVSGVGKFPGLMVDDSGLTFNTSASHILTVGGNNMITGTVYIDHAQVATTLFSGFYNAPPNCVLTPQQDLSGIGWWVSTTPTSITAHLSLPMTVTFTYFCAGDPN
jgi:hypothetical protein